MVDNVVFVFERTSVFLPSVTWRQNVSAVNLIDVEIKAGVCLWSLLCRLIHWPCFRGSGLNLLGSCAAGWETAFLHRNSGNNFCIIHEIFKQRKLHIFMSTFNKSTKCCAEYLTVKINRKKSVRSRLKLCFLFSINTLGDHLNRSMFFAAN